MYILPNFSLIYKDFSVYFLPFCGTFLTLSALFGKRIRFSMLEVETNVDDAVPILDGVSFVCSAMVLGIS